MLVSEDSVGLLSGKMGRKTMSAAVTECYMYFIWLYGLQYHRVRNGSHWGVAHGEFYTHMSSENVPWGHSKSNTWAVLAVLCAFREPYASVAGDTSLQESILVQNQSYVIEGTELWINNAYRQETCDAWPLMCVDRNFSNKHQIRLWKSY